MAQTRYTRSHSNGNVLYVHVGTGSLVIHTK